MAQAVAYTARAVLAIVILRRVIVLRYDNQAVRTAISGNVLMASAGLMLAAVIPNPWSMPTIVVAAISIYFLALMRKLTQNDIDLVWRLMPSRLLAARSGAWFMRGIARLLCEPSTTTSEAK